MNNLKQHLDIFKKWQTWLLIILIVCAFTRFYRLGYIKEYVFDEVYHAFTAKMYSLERYEAWVWWESPPEGVAYEWTHPPLAKVIMSWGINLFGGPGEMPDKARDPSTLLSNLSFGWRFFSALFGVFATGALFLFSSKLFNNKWIGVLSAFLFTFDLLPLVQSRTAMNDIFAVTFLLLAFYFSIKRSTDGLKYPLPSPLLSYKLPIYNWLLSSLFLGCAISSKWTALFGIGIMGFYHLMTLFYHFTQSYFHKRASLYEMVEESFTDSKFKHGVKYLAGLFLRVLSVQAIYTLVFIFVIPYVIYILSYWQLFTLKIDDYKGNSLSEEIVRKESAQEADEGTIARWKYFYEKSPHLADRFYIWWGVQKQMWWYHTNLKATHNYTSQWWTWPLNIRPVWFYVKYCGISDANLDSRCKDSLAFYNSQKTIGDVYTMGNPVIFWLIFPVIGYVFYKTTRGYRKWFAMIIPAVSLILTGWNFSQVRPKEIKSMWEHTVITVQNIVPQIILFVMLIGLFLMTVKILEILFSKDYKKLREKVSIPFLIAIFISMLAFSGFWLPWSRSPRIMFFYHFFPPVTFIYPVIAYCLYAGFKKSKQSQKAVMVYLGLVVISFIYFYPHVTGMLLPEWQREQFIWIQSWK
ncbi:MAG: phospholipid carrier-dependent glycosyltransferase [bacterium]|nr:phospholipid carrier-dependent glycosyltransferase [bacterium]